MKPSGPAAGRPSRPWPGSEGELMNNLAVSISLLAVIFAMVALLYASVGSGGMGGSINGARHFEPGTMQKILGTVFVLAIFFWQKNRHDLYAMSEKA